VADGRRGDVIDDEQSKFMERVVVCGKKGKKKNIQKSAQSYSLQFFLEIMCRKVQKNGPHRLSGERG
jgi:hypothetical protein